MRLLLLLAALGLLFGVATAAPLPADTVALRINRLPTDGLLLDKGWRYQAGDDPAWARPGFDDSAWETFDPLQALHKLPPRLRTGISWLRLRFRPADSLRRRALQLQLLGYGAWEVYLNGRLVQRSGSVPIRSGPVPAPDQLPAIEVPENGPSEQVLAIRLAPWQSPLLRLRNGSTARTLLQVHLRDEAQGRQWASQRIAATMVNCAAAAIFGLLTLLHLAFFRNYPAQRANLYFAFFALATALSSAAAILGWGLTFPALGTQLLLQFISRLLLGMAYLWALRALYVLFGFQTGWVYKVLWIGFGATVALGLGGASFQSSASSLLILLVNMELVRLTVRALRQRRRGAWLVGAGFGAVVVVIVGLTLSALISALLQVSNPLQFLSNGNWAVGLLFLLAPALGISLYLAREFALDSQLLQVKLGEVERLSAQTLAQEQEKQALLAAQNETLETQVAQRTAELQRSLTDLRATQAQLIQKEKMASLGELTAGIAHEIQNPLNFVNNFSEVSSELMEELEEAQAAGDGEEVAALAEDVRQNLGKITEHGKRAAAIVKGMLEHSRTSTGERAPTDINALCDEYLRLAYQGLRAKDKSFNATLITDFAAGLPLVEAAAADLGRVLLNLFGNAFYAVQKRQQTGEASYQPTVSVSTKQVGSCVEIRVRDNGVGIPVDLKAKIFQPFFTTKPTGEGTGLGLSLSYDIVTQGHGGTLTVESQPGNFTEFLISLPLN